MLQSQDYEAIEASLLALLALAFGSERNKIRIVKAGVITVLLDLFQCQNLVIFHSEVKILNLVNDDPNNTSSFSMQAIIDAIATLQNLSTCHQIIPSMDSSGVIYSLLQLIHCSKKSTELTEKAMALLENIISSSENSIQETTRTGGAIRVLVEVVEGGSPQCKEHAVEVLLRICQSCRDKYRGLILMEGVMPGLLQLTVDGTWRAKNMAQKLLLLLRDCSDNASTTSKQSKHELVEHIMKAIDADGESYWIDTEVGR